MPEVLSTGCSTIGRPRAAASCSLLPAVLQVPPCVWWWDAALLGDLRQLPSKAALQLRADVAQAASVAGSQRSEIEKMVIRLAKQGV